MLKIKDQLGREVSVNHPPKRIISLVPSITELLYDIGLTKETIAITKFCVHPKKWMHEKERIGGTKNLNLNKIKELNPDLIIANKEENIKEQIDQLSLNYPIYVSDINNHSEALEFISDLGIISNKEEECNSLINKIKEGINYTSNQYLNKNCVYLIWNKPMMLAGGDNYINTNLQHLGFNNIGIKDNKHRYPEITSEELKQLNPEYIFLSTEPYPFNEDLVSEFQKNYPNSIVKLVNGEMFSWYGSRMVLANNYFKSFLDPHN